MKILYLRLNNSAGIYAGMSRRNIEIDFTKGTNNIVMLFGGNGSGKSTIISALHPFTGTCNDERDRFFIEGENGEKEIHYLVDNTVYMIVHYVSAKNKTKSYMSTIPYSDYVTYTSKSSIYKDGEELNENGGVNTFKELVETHLGVDEEFFKISRIGTNVTNFIDLTTANRKKYISTFLPNIDEYLQRYKIVNDKYKAMTKEIKYLSDEILKLEDENSLKTEKTRLEKQLELIRNNMENCSTQIATAKANVASLDKDGIFKASKYENPYVKDLFNLENEKEKIEKITSIYSLDVIEKDLETTENSLNEIKNSISQTQDRLSHNKENLGTISVSIKAKEKQLSGMSMEDIDWLKENLKNNSNKILDLQKELDELDLSSFNKDILSSSNINSQTTYAMKRIYNTLSEEKNKCSIDYERILKKIFISKNMTLEDLKTIIGDLKKTKKDKETEKSDLIKELTTANSNRKYLNILEQRPEDCIDNSCPFVATALQYQNIESEISDLETKIEETKKDIETCENDISIFENVESIGSTIERLYKDNSDTFEILTKTFTNLSINIFNDLMVYMLETNTNSIKKDFFNNADSISFYNSLIAEISDLEKENTHIKEKITTNESIGTLYKDLQSELNSMKEQQNKVETTIENEKQTLTDYQKEQIELLTKQSSLNTIKEEFDKKEKFLENYNSVKENYENAQNVLEEISKLAGVVADNKESKEEYSKQIPILETSLDGVKLKISKLKDYTDRKKKLDTDYEKTSWIKDALNPTKGIPVYFIDDYLDRTKFITNNLLDISQHGKFAISFEVTDKDFFIKVYKNNGDVLSDISQASQGETSLTSLSLSLALMEQSMKNYNIFLLDELDGSLDTGNRRSFIDMVNAQMKILNSEQVFIISHNNEFENIPIDMILLNGNDIDTNNKEFMENKTVIFNV